MPLEQSSGLVLEPVSELVWAVCVLASHHGGMLTIGDDLGLSNDCPEPRVCVQSFGVYETFCLIPSPYLSSPICDSSAPSFPQLPGRNVF